MATITNLQDEKFQADFVAGLKAMNNIVRHFASGKYFTIEGHSFDHDVILGHISPTKDVRFLPEPHIITFREFFKEYVPVGE